MEQKHTPGPWYADPYEDDCDGIGVCAKGKGIVADVDSDYCEPEEMRANAHLIAAAPEMKEALAAIVEILATWRAHPCPGFGCQTCQGERLQDIARAAIATAEGR